jgi:HdeA/HdeB family
MTNTVAKQLTSLIALMLFNSTMSFAQMPDNLDLAALTCKDLMRQTDRDREATIAFLHGFMAGQKKAMTVDIKKLETETDKVVDQCLDNPRTKVMDVFAKN